MDVKKVFLGLTLSLLLGGGVFAAADFSKGVDAYESEDFKTGLNTRNNVVEMLYARIN